MTDIITTLIDAPTAAELRAARPQARDNAQEAFEALLEGEILPPGVAYDLALIVARSAGVDRAVEFYADLAAEEPAQETPALRAARHWAWQLATRPASANALDIADLPGRGGPRIRWWRWRN